MIEFQPFYKTKHISFLLCLPTYYSFPTTRELSLYTGIIKNCAKAYKLKSGFWKEDKFMLPHEIKSLKL